jgi:hypothetical protein
MENKQQLIDELDRCAGQCTHCYDACQMEKEKNKLQRCMMFDQDCADICRLCGQVLERNSENTASFLKLCAELCEKCAAECEKYADMEHCKKCAEACRKCAEMCNNYQPVHQNT